MGIIQNIRNFFTPAPKQTKDVQKRRYEGATKGRRAKNWFTQSFSANSELRFDLVTLRNRSRDLCRNNPYAKRAVQAIANNTVGSGIRPKPFEMKAGPEKQLKRAWMNWAESVTCDFDGMYTFYGLQKLVMRALVESGECLVIRKYNRGKLQIQVLESDHIDNNMDGMNERGRVIMGIQFDKSGNKIGYWLYDHHPGEIMHFGDLPSVYYPIENVLHIFEKLRPGQVRGVPFGVSVFLRLKDFDEYEDAQLVRQKIAACFSVFVTGDAADYDTQSDVDILERVEPGIIEVLPPGKQITMAAPPGTGTDYGPYTQRVLQAVAAGFGVPYEILTTDLSNVNFSSGRMGFMEFYRSISEWQDNILIPLLCQPVWAWFVEWQFTLGNIRKLETATWTTPRRSMIDPEKEAKSYVVMIQNGLMSWQEAIRQLGYDPDDVANEFKQDYEMFDKYGMKVLIDMRNTLVQQPTEEPPTE
jgi:lambda family phage portal protein